MAVRWSDGSFTGSVRVETPAPVPVEPEPETTEPAEKSVDKKEVKDGAR